MESGMSSDEAAASKSKRQLKRELKQARYLESRDAWKIAKKEKKRQKKAAIQISDDSHHTSRASFGLPILNAERNGHVYIDCGYDGLMTPKVTV